MQRHEGAATALATRRCDNEGEGLMAPSVAQARDELKHARRQTQRAATWCGPQPPSTAGARCAHPTQR